MYVTKTKGLYHSIVESESRKGYKFQWKMYAT